VQDARSVRVPGAGEELRHDVAHLVLVERLVVTAPDARVLAQVHGPGVLRDDEAVAVGAAAVGVRGEELDDGRVAAARREGHDLPREVRERGPHEAVVGPPRQPLHGDEALQHAVPGLVHVAEHALAKLLEALVPLRHGRQPGDRGHGFARRIVLLLRRLLNLDGGHGFAVKRCGSNSKARFAAGGDEEGRLLVRAASVIYGADAGSASTHRIGIRKRKESIRASSTDPDPVGVPY